MKRILITLSVLFCYFMSFAQDGRLSGKVSDTRALPLPAVRVTLQPSGLVAVSDSTGRFVFNNLAEGDYELVAELMGYKRESVRVRLRRNRMHVELVMHDDYHQLREVVVEDDHIARRRQSESLNVEVVDQNFIQRNLGGSLMTTLSRLPGVKTIGIGSGQSKPLIRGLGFNRVVVVDKGVKHEAQQWGADHGLEIDQFSAGEVELIKGAASFIYGSDAIAGAINVKPAPLPAAHTLGGSVDMIGKTNNNLYGTSANFFGRSQHWFFDSRVTYQNYGDYMVPTDTVYVYDFAVGLDNKHLRNTAGRETGFHFNTGYVSDHLRSVLYVSHTHSNSGFFANAHGLEPRMVDTTLHDASARDILMPRQDVKHFKVINSTTYTRGIHQLEAELGYQRNFRQEFSQYVNHGYMPAVYPDTMSIPIGLEREFEKNVYSLNLRDKIGLGRHSLTLGFNVEHQDNAINGWTFLIPGFKQTNLGAFVYDKWWLSDNLLLHGAVRYDNGKVQVHQYTDWFESEVEEGGQTVNQKVVRAENLTRTFNSLVWSAGMNYNREKFEFKANIGKSFRMPITKELAANGVNYHYFSYEKGSTSLDPEQSYQADISIGWNEARWSVQISPFYNYFPNYIYLNPTSQHSPGPGAGYQLFQYAQSRVMRYGGELQFMYRITNNLSTELLGEYLYARQLSGDKEGFTLPFSPPPSALLNLTWSPELGGKLSKSYFSVDYRLTARQNNIVPPEKKTPGYGVINLQAGTRLQLYRQPLMISLQAQNLLNTRYMNHTSFYRLIELPESGRNLILSLKIPFMIGSQNNQ